MMIDEEMVNVAVFGKEVEMFLESPIGSYLVKQAEREVNDAVQQLKGVAPWRRRRIQDLQNRVKVAEFFQVWLGDAVARGRQATEILEDEHE